MLIKTEKKLCSCCMEHHDIQTIRELYPTIFKGYKFEYELEYNYCDRTDEMWETEEQITKNDLVMKNTYRKLNNLLTGTEIKAIRSKYHVSQTDLAVILGWGEKTITRYEGHQVQDKAHDSILRKIDTDAEWFLSLLNLAKDNISADTYKKASTAACILEEQNRKDFNISEGIEFVAKNMIRNHVPTETIQLYTQLSSDRINQLAKNLKVAFS